ncbi:hypothetical protein ACVXG8_17865 [Escherichia coli]
MKIDQQLATVAVIHQQHMPNIAQWLQENGITRATVAPDWMSIPCGFMAGDAQRVICRIDECRGWSAGRRWLRSCSAPSSMSRIYRFR